MLSLFTGALLAVAAPQSATPPPDMGSARPSSIPADIDADAVCLLVMTQLHGGYQKLPPEKQQSMADVDKLTQNNMSFFLGAVSARRTDAELVAVFDKSAHWLWAKNNDETATVAAGCYAWVKPRMQSVPNALRAVAKANPGAGL